MVRFRILRRYLAHPWVRTVLGGLIVLVCLYYLGQTFVNMPALPTNIRIRHSWLVLSGAVTIVTIWLGAIEWWLILRSLGHDIDIRHAVRAHLRANLAKYLPGYGWQLLSKVHLTVKPHVSFQAVSVALTIEFGLMLYVGLCMALILASTFSRAHEFFAFGLWPWLGTGGLVALLLAIWAAPVLVARLPVAYRPIALNRGLLSAAVAIATIGWSGLGTIFWTVAVALWPLSIYDLPLLSFAMITATLWGLIVVLVPAGVGVRESVLVFVLTPSLAPAAILLTAVLVRVVLAIGEVLSLVLTELLLFVLPRQYLLPHLPSDYSQVEQNPDQSQYRQIH